ncbi:MULTISPECIES: Pls/PosA family non-ribosomal peptide synthetase [unclassified Corynebacterium]|uniref:Pls/PosA family non-ribosomal peptide synthetase n=1 Tax=unclassified Corynebacterium TaxID=2624378 RepID=UPI00265428DC|nr:AMP-binding protein [Corynebacterium sp.]
MKRSSPQDVHRPVHDSATDHPSSAIFGVAQAPAPRTLIDILNSTTVAHPDALALVGGDTELTYEQLAASIAEQVERLTRAGIRPGDRVGVRVPSGTTDLYVAILATLAAGAAYVPVDWDDPDARARKIWAEADVAAVFGAGLALDPAREPRPATPTPDAPSSPTVDDDAWIIFTSGSTGTPKGVAVTHRAAAALVDAEARMYLTRDPLHPGDRVMAGLSVAFDASCEEMWLAWRYGAALVAAPRDVVRSGDSLGAWITNNRISAVSTVPTLASFWPVDALDNVRLLIFGGEALPVELVNRLARDGRELWNTYGPTEATVISTGQLMDEVQDGQPVRIGRATPGWRLAVVDPSTGEPVRWGESGELVVAGVGLGRYLDPVKDAEVYAPLPALGWDRAYRTGDLVVADREGLVFAGRADDQIKFGGRRMELGEIDRALATIEGVGAAAAAKQTTPAGSDVIVGYVVPDDRHQQTGEQIDLRAAREHLRAVLPGGISPTLCTVAELPLKTSGKVDRSALPWPLPDDGGGISTLPAELHALGQMWTDLLGPVPLDADSDFFDLGGSSVAIAKLATSLRATHPAVNIGALYDHSTLTGMADYVAGLRESNESRPMPAGMPWWSGVVQFLVVCGIYVLNAARYIVGSILVIWALAFFFEAGWVPYPPLAPLLVGWLVLFSLPGKVVQATVVARLLTHRITPGTYPRGGLVHLRIWAAERVLTYLKLEPLLGTPVTPVLFRLFGCRVGRGTELQTFPPVTGLLSVGDDTTLEHEVDVNGHWLDGDTLHVGVIRVGDEVRVGMRSWLGPGADLRDGCEILAGSSVAGWVPAHRLYGGSPPADWGEAGLTWPEQSPEDAAGDGAVGTLSRLPHRLLYMVGLAWMGLLPLLAILPGTFLVLPHVVERTRYEDVFPTFAAWVPVFTLLTILTWISLVIVTVRLSSLLIRPGYFPTESTTGWALWLTHTMMQKTLTSTYFLYAAWYTPAFLRLLGARVGQGNEISTVETIPHLTSIGDRCFLADHSMCTASRHRAGWIHVGTTVLGNGSFVGNSGIVGPDYDLPEKSLIAVLSSTPYRAERGTSWLGRQTREIPRRHVEADLSKTFNPGPGLRGARASVEFLRLVPPVIAAYLDLFIVWAGTTVYMRSEPGWPGIWTVCLWSVPIVLVAGVVACLVPVLAKWLIVGRFTAGERTLYSTFVWRSELVDNFVEMLAVPSLIRVSLGSPLYNWWCRLMGTRVGRAVWCETWWLPEFDIISIDDHATVNRGTVLQTHLFHDRVMSLDHVSLGAGSTLGPNSFLLPGASIGPRTTVRPGSLVLRGDAIPSDSVWAGNPVTHVNR